MKKFFYLLAFAAFMSTISCSSDQDETGNIDLVMKLTYEGEPLEMFKDYQYPDGRLINFNRFSIYTNEVSVGSEILTDIDFHNLTNSHATADDAANGYKWSLNDVKSGDYSSLSFDIGIPPAMNAMSPEDFESDHPLAKNAEYWFGWSSYVFAKVEGLFDTDSDGTLEQSFALHLGADEALRSISLNKDIIIKDGETTTVEIEIDVYDFLGGTDDTYDIDSNPQIHTPNQQDQVVELADNLKSAVK